MEPRPDENPLYDLVLPRAEVLGAVATLLGAGLLFGYGHPTAALQAGLLTLAVAFFLRAFQPPLAPADEAPAYVPVAARPPAELPAIFRHGLAFASAATLAGVLCKLQRWPDGPLLLPVGTVALAVLVAGRPGGRR